MKKILLVGALACCFIPTVFAADAASSSAGDNSGVYFGLQAGYANSGLDVLVSETTWPIRWFSVDKNTGGAARLFVGYDINKYFGIEAGYFSLLRNPSVTYIATNDNRSVKISALDLVAKVKAPLSDEMGVYAKAGVGYLMVNKLAEILPNIEGAGSSSKQADLVCGFGAYYNLTNDWSMDVSFTKYTSGSPKIYGSQKWQPSVNFYALGVAYKIPATVF